MIKNYQACLRPLPNPKCYWGYMCADLFLKKYTEIVRAFLHTASSKGTPSYHVSFQMPVVVKEATIFI